MTQAHAIKVSEKPGILDIKTEAHHAYAGPIFNPATHDRIELQGQVDEAWLQSILGTTEIIIAETMQIEDVTAINVQTDQSGIVGLVRRLHGMGIAIRQLQVVSEREPGDCHLSNQ